MTRVDNRGEKAGEKRVICKCNNISLGEIQDAIRDGADTMNKIFDATTAGVGPCGGSCRRVIQPLLDGYLKTGEFSPIPPTQQPKRRR